MTRKKIWIAAMVALVLVAALAGGWWWWRGRPPQAVRLLPEADVYGYINVAMLRRAGAAEKAPELIDVPEYHDFLQAANIVPSRDVDEIGIARSAELESAQPGHNSYIVIGRFSMERARPWLEGHATQQSDYRAHRIYLVAVQGHAVRITFLDEHAMAVTNAPTEEAIHQIVERFESTWPAKTTLVAEHYREVPLGSAGWMIGRFAAQPVRRGGGLLSNSLRRLMAGCVIEGSARYLGNVELRLDALAASDEQARRIAEDANTFLQIYRSAEFELKPGGGGDPDVKAALASLKVEQDGRRATLRAEIPTRVLEKVGR